MSEANPQGEGQDGPSNPLNPTNLLKPPYPDFSRDWIKVQWFHVRGFE